MARARFEYWNVTQEDGAEDWHWHLKGGNGEIMAQGEGYTRKADVLRAIRTFKQVAASAEPLHIDADVAL